MTEKRTLPLLVDQDNFIKYLQEEKFVTKHQVAKAQQVNQSNNKPEALFTTLAKLGLIAEKALVEQLSNFTKIDVLKSTPINLVSSQRLSKAFITEHQIIPFDEDENHIYAALTNPFNTVASDALSYVFDKPCVCYITEEGVVKEALMTLEKKPPDTEELFENYDEHDLDQLKDLSSEAPVIKFVNKLLQDAVLRRVSDIHIEPMDQKVSIRIRRDGQLEYYSPPELKIADAIVSRIKIMAALDIAEKRLPQDGRIRLAIQGNDIDFRVSTTPTVYGESVVLRVLNKAQLALGFDEIQFPNDILPQYLSTIEQPHGIVIVTGPTGSGKTTTLYTSLSHLHKPNLKILTIEDPIEYAIDGINQVQVNPQIGLTFPSALKSFLRQDPDIMMVGEIRDVETGKVAIQAALTGHLILSTLHTNSAAEAIVRLLDMELEDYLLASTISGIIGQRLVRKLCEHCKTPLNTKHDPWLHFFSKHHLEHSVTYYSAKGCEKCRSTGYSGRVMIIEFLAISENIKALINSKTDAQNIQRKASEEGMRTLFEHGLLVAKNGITSLEEVIRVTLEQKS